MEDKMDIGINVEVEMVNGTLIKGEMVKDSSAGPDFRFLLKANIKRPGAIPFEREVVMVNLKNVAIIIQS